MDNNFPLADIIFFAAIAVFIFLKLRNQLGKIDTDEEKRKREALKKFLQDKNNKNLMTDDDKKKIINLAEQIAGKKALLQGVAEKKAAAQIAGKEYTKELDETSQNELTETLEKMKTDVNLFIKGARKAFEMVITAFASEDKKTLKSLLSAKAYDNFADEIDKRAKTGNRLETTLISILSSSIVSVKVTAKNIQIAVKFVSEQINIIRDKNGKVIKGDVRDIDTVSNTWTFKKEIDSAPNDKNWTIVATSN